MSKDNSQDFDEQIENKFEDVDIALDINPDADSDHIAEEEEYEMSQYEYELEEARQAAIAQGKLPFEVTNPGGGIAGVYDWIRCIIFAIAIVVVCLTFVFRLVDVDGTSMNDTLQTKDKVIVTDLFYTPHNNDIVVISHGAVYEKPIIKRVIATPGQRIKLDFANERIIVDGVELNEPYIKGTTFSGNYGNNEIPEVIPEGKLFVMGDNRAVSLDSRSVEVGLIDVGNVIGKAQFVAFPFNNFGYLY